jgi:medium-chain acyl-[acyl-carrier-protein] hydrolase
MSSSEWIYYPRPRPPAAVRLFAFPYAGGSAHAYHELAQHLSARLELAVVQLPGRGVRLGEPVTTDLAVLVQQLLGAVGDHLAKPFAFFGHSTGALTAFELARALRREGGPAPDRLMVSACAAPHLPRPGRRLHDLPDEDLVAALAAIDGQESVALRDEGARALLLPAVRADICLAETYRYRAERPLAVPIHALYGREDQMVLAAQVAGWSLHTDMVFTMNGMPGGHFYFRSRPERVCATLLAALC